MNKKPLRPRRLTLHRETLRRLDERRLAAAGGRGERAPFVTEGDNCTSPLCGPTTCGCGGGELG